MMRRSRRLSISSKTPPSSAGSAFLAALALALIAGPVEAGWLQDAVGGWLTETLTDLQVIGVTCAIIGFIVGVVMWFFTWGNLRIPVIAVVGGTLVSLADTFIGG